MFWPTESRLKVRISHGPRSSDKARAVTTAAAVRKVTMRVPTAVPKTLAASLAPRDQPRKSPLELYYDTSTNWYLDTPISAMTQEPPRQVPAIKTAAIIIAATISPSKHEYIQQSFHFCVFLYVDARPGNYKDYYR